jgi:hypothetical protein
MEINEVKIGDQVTFTHKKKKVTGKVIYRHEGKDKVALMGHVNVNIEDGGSHPVTVHVSKLKPALKEETSMNEENIEHTLDLIDFIASENHVEAEKQFDAILQDKIDIILDAAKQEVAENIFNTQECAECTEEVEEAVVMKPTPAVQAAIDAYKKKKAAATHDGKTNPPMPAVKKEEVEITSEALKGNQHKIDANKNGKIDAHDFKLLGRKKLKLLGRKTPKSERMDRNLAKRVENNKSMKVEQNVFTGHKSIKHANLETPETQKRRDDDVKKRQAGRVAVIKKLNAKGAKIGEEVKQVDELKSTTLRSYIKKAKADGKEKSKMSDDIKNIYSPKKPSWTGKTIIANLAAAKTKRDGKIAMAKDKLKTEEAEQVDELSKQALSTYVKKAGPQIAGLEQKHGIASKPAMKRRRGVTRASINYLKKDLGMPTRKEEA